jgi:NarL family two-component system response regulator LiaR
MSEVISAASPAHAPYGACAQMTTGPTRVLLADDHGLVRRGIVASFEGYDEVQVVGEAASGEEALRLVEQVRPDVVLMDLLMPGMGGFAATRELRDRFPELQVVVLTNFQDGEMVQQALQAGALGYLLKDVEVEDLVKAIRLAHRGMPTLAPAATQTLVREVARRPPTLGHDLTERERAVLALLAAGLSNQQIGERLVITPATVKFHMRSIRSKLGTSSRTETVVVALRHRLVPPPEGLRAHPERPPSG